MGNGLNRESIYLNYKYYYHKFFKEILESLSGKERDYTTEKLKRAIFLLSVPMVLEMVMESVFAVVDIYFVSKLGASAVAAVGLTESMMSIIYAIAFGLSTSATAIISRRIGEKNTSGATNAAVQAIIAGTFVSMLIAIPGFFLAPQLLQLIGAEPKIYHELYGYTRIMFSTNIVIILLFIINGILRSAGDAAFSMRVLWFGNLINLILDPILIFGWWFFPKMGIEGAAVATSIGRGLAIIYQLTILFNGKSRIKIKLSDLKIDFKIITKIFKLSFGSIGQNIIATSSWIGLVSILATFGSTVVAAYTIAIRIIIFSLLPSWGMSNAASTLVGQNLGANLPERAEKAVWLTGKYNLILMGLIGLIYILFPHYWVGLFINDIEVIAHGAECLRIVSYGYLAYGLGMIIVHSFNGAGDTITPIKINLFMFWLFEIPLAYLLAKQWGAGEHGVYYAIIIAETILTLTAIILFKRGKWKEQKV